MKNVISYLRIKEWLSSKVTMMMGIFLYFLYLNNNSKHSLMGIAAYFLFVSAFLAISYIVNDFSDIEVDRKAGKQKVIANMKKWQILLSILVIFLIGNVPVLLYCNSKVLAIFLIVITYLGGLAYSTLGIRFKEKGVWGLIECSLAQKCMPLSLIYVMQDLKNMQVYLLIVWMIISFLDGIRYIVIHQIIDLDNDKKGGIVTFVSQKKRNYRKTLIVLLILLIAGVIGILFPIIIDHILISVIFCIAFTLLEFGIYKVLCVFAKKDWICTFDSVPLEAFLNCGMPMLIGICIALRDYYMWIFVGVVLVLSFRLMAVKWNIAKLYYFPDKRKEK